MRPWHGRGMIETLCMGLGLATMVASMGWWRAEWRIQDAKLELQIAELRMQEALRFAGAPTEDAREVIDSIVAGTELPE